MRYFQTLPDAIGEIKRDVKKGGLATQSSRVQNKIGMNLQARERMCYLYAIAGGFPSTPEELIDLAVLNDFEFYTKERRALANWMARELDDRLLASQNLGPISPLVLADALHPALKSTIEGSWPAYRYPERLNSMIDFLLDAHQNDPYTRRAYWPIYEKVDAIRMAAPTRIPCSLGYQTIIRNVNGEDLLLMIYYSRSVDLDRFWLTDIWFARKIQETIADRLKIKPGVITHFIASFHSFEAEAQEIY
jgi:thymidylate synthase